MWPCIDQAFLPFSKNSRPKKLKVKKLKAVFQPKTQRFGDFWGSSQKNSKEKIVHKKIFIWVDALNVIFMDMFVDFCNI